jgi:hypothetical protein
MTFPASFWASMIVRNTKPGPPELDSSVAVFPALKSAIVPAHRVRFVPAVLFSNVSFNTAGVVVSTAIPVRRYFPLVPTVPVIVITHAMRDQASIKHTSTVGRSCVDFRNLGFLVRTDNHADSSPDKADKTLRPIRFCKWFGWVPWTQSLPGLPQRKERRPCYNRCIVI